MTAKEPQNILEALNLSELLPEEQEEILLDIHELILKGTLVRLAEQMDEKMRGEFEVLLDADSSEEEIADFIEKNVPNADNALEETVAELTNDILAATKE
jgi:16S rRNA C1402 (ribose-2'-O) methylase RsmI